MKMFLVVLLAAFAYAEPEAEPKADSQFLGYPGWGYGLGYRGLGYRGYPYTSYPYTSAYRYFAKRDAEPEADSQFFYNNWGYGLGYPYYNSAYHYGYPYTSSYRYIAKRDADSEPEADPQWLIMQQRMAMANPAIYPASYKYTYPSTVIPSAISSKLVYPSYMSKLTYPTIATHFVKREAESEPESKPEADPQFFYGNYWNYPATTMNWGAIPSTVIPSAPLVSSKLVSSKLVYPTYASKLVYPGIYY